MVLGVLFVQGSSISIVHAQSIPVFPPLTPASIDVEELDAEGLDEAAEAERSNGTESNGEVDNGEADEGQAEVDTEASDSVDGVPPSIDEDETTVDIDTNHTNDSDLVPDAIGPEVVDTDEAVDTDIEAVEDAEIDRPEADLELDEVPSVEDLDEPFDAEIDESLVDDLDRLEDLDEPLVDDLEVDTDLDRLDNLPLDDALNEAGDLLPLEQPERGNANPIPLETFKPRQRTSIFEDVVLTPNAMTNPTTLRGISGGPLTASRVAGRTDTATGICTGFVDRKPDHRIELTAFFDYLSLQVESPEDTVLVVRGPGGSWCNDDVVGFNPGLAGEWFSGVYDVWVGSYNELTYHPYVIRLSDSQ